MARACARAATETGQRFYLYGGRDQGALCSSALNLRRRFPGINIVGGYAPPFRPLSDEERAAVVEEINESEADVVWVGIGVPKQEKWMAAMRPHLEAPVLVGVGAAFDFHAGLVPQAPPRLQKAGTRVGLPARPGAAPAVAALPALQPPFRGRLRAPARRPPGRRRAVPNPLPVERTRRPNRHAPSGAPLLRLPGRDLKELLGDAVPGDHARQTLADRYAEREIGRPQQGPWRVLDLGCGAGGSVDVFRARDPDVQWVGLDVPGLARGQRARRAPTLGSRPSTGSRCRSRTGPSTSSTASRSRARPPSRAAARRGAPGPEARRMVRRLDLPARALSLAQPVELHPGRLPRSARARRTFARSRCAPGSTA